ncbi:MAG: hypothetical protein WBE91_21335 [Steroidobacteraceae bacterium]
MNAIQKATFAASALAITLVGAALVTAPIAFARPLPVAVAAHAAWAGVTANAGLLALNRR